ncbi:hypothetical protein DMN91_011668 [Ooceraea biroi]|uniref:Uncharacterized protein n=1 Tax=Ooceraea biroi TaxID=2015173 RepID=A0A3L8D6T5_OOCBI|nr:hypothetical protein DMN91_011668 [Ooceraea biroi]
MTQQEPTVYDLAYRGRTAAVKILLNESERLKTQTDNNGRMLIHWAALGGHDDLVRHLLSLDVPVDPEDDTNMTPLILAASAGREKVVNTLLTEGADVNATTVDGHSALQYAASKNWKAICMALLEKDANVNIADKRDQRDAYGNTPLHLACEEDRVEEAKLLVARGADPTITNKERKTPLDLASRGLVRQLEEIKRETAKSK